MTFQKTNRIIRGRRPARHISSSLVKMLHLLLLPALLQLSIKLRGQSLPSAVSHALPKGYEVLNFTSGDFNLDDYPDFIVVLNRPNEKETSDLALHPEKRPC